MRLALRNNQLSIKFTYSVTFTFPLPAKPGFINFGKKKWYKNFLLKFYQTIGKTLIYVMAE